jgi:hypothetical protein
MLERFDAGVAREYFGCTQFPYRRLVVARNAFFSFALLFGSSLISAHGFSQTSALQVIASDTVREIGVSCPVGLVVRPSGAGAMVQIGGRPQEPAPQLQLSWENRHAKDVVAATIVVGGYDASPRVIPADHAVSPKLKKTYNLMVKLASEGKATTDLTHAPSRP